MKQCSKCGKQCDDSAAFCPYCGQKLGMQEVVPAGCSEEVRSLWERAVNGNAEDQYELGHYYQKGIHGVVQNAGEAVKWYRKAAEQGLRGAQCDLGICYEHGEGVAQNASEAVKWYRKAAEQGHADAQCLLGACYENGIGITQNADEAMKWYRKAVEIYYQQATEDSSYILSMIGQYKLGVCYEKGRGVIKNEAEAIMWYQKAADRGYEQAEEALERLGNQQLTCPTCGAKTLPGRVFCANCGTKLAN